MKPKETQNAAPGCDTCHRWGSHFKFRGESLGNHSVRRFSSPRRVSPRKSRICVARGGSAVGRGKIHGNGGQSGLIEADRKGGGAAPVVRVIAIARAVVFSHAAVQIAVVVVIAPALPVSGPSPDCGTAPDSPHTHPGLRVGIIVHKTGARISAGSDVQKRKARPIDRGKRLAKLIPPSQPHSHSSANTPARFRWISLSILHIAELLSG